MNTYSLQIIPSYVFINIEIIENVEIYKRIEKELKNKIKSKSYKNIKTISDNENDPFVLSGRKDGKGKTSFCRPSLSV